MPDFCHPDVLTARQQSAPESEKLRWANSGYKSNELSGLWETQDGHLFYSDPIFQLLLSTAHHSVFEIIRSVNRHWWGDFDKTAKVVTFSMSGP